MGPPFTSRTSASHGPLHDWNGALLCPGSSPRQTEKSLMSSIHTLNAAAGSGRSPGSAYAGRQSTNRRMGFSLNRETIAAAIIYAAVLFNFGLSFVNANGMQIGRTHVILVEL